MIAKWEKTLNTKYAFDAFMEDDDKQGLAHNLAFSIKMGLLRSLDRTLSEMEDKGVDRDSDEYYEVWAEADKWRDVRQNLKDYANGEEWADDFHTVMEEFYDLADFYRVEVAF